MSENKTIGENIREFRLKRGYTQESLATELHVSPQAVSKWETGQSMPDINILIPLSRVLEVGVDQLLGGDRRAEFERNFQKALPYGELISLLVCEDALKDFPDDATFLYRRACSELFIGEGCEHLAPNERKMYLNRAVFHFGQLHAKYPENDNYTSMLAKAYFEQGNRELAVNVANQCKNESAVLESFLQGDDKIYYYQKKIHSGVIQLFSALCKYNTRESIVAAHALLDTMMGKDKPLNATLFWNLYNREASFCLEDGDADGFLSKLTMAYELALEADRLDRGTATYDSPLFDRLTVDCDRPREFLGFLTDSILADSSANELKRRIVDDNVFTCRPLLRHEWVNYFRFCQQLINSREYFNFGIAYDLTAEESNALWDALRDRPKYPGNATAELIELHRAQIERLISNGVMSGCVAHYDNFIFAYCNCGDKDKYRGFPFILRPISTAPESAKIFAIMEMLVANSFKDCGLEDKLLAYALEYAKSNGYTHAEVYPQSYDGVEFESMVEYYKNAGFTVIKDLSEGYSRWFIMQKVL